MTDWEVFRDSVPWFLSKESDVCVGETHHAIDLASCITQKMPLVSRLLNRAAVTPVTIDGGPHELFSWDSVDGTRMGWLCLAIPQGDTGDLFADHKLLLGAFGGIVERYNEPDDTWLLNTNDSLTLREAANNGSFIEDYSWAFEDAGIEIPLQLTDYYSISREANANDTLCHRLTGEVVLFAPDHSFEHVSVYPGCPDYTLYTIDGVRGFSEWVESIARQWLAEIGDA